jgi:hypothetical protein
VAMNDETRLAGPEPGGARIGRRGFIGAGLATAGVSLISPKSGAATPQAPTVVTGAPSAVTTTGCQLNGSVNPNGNATSYYTQWAIDPTLSSAGGFANPVGTTPNLTGTSIGAGTSPVSLTTGGSNVLSALTAGRQYYVQLVAYNSGGTAYGVVLNFMPTAAASQLIFQHLPSDGLTTAHAPLGMGAQCCSIHNPDGSLTGDGYDSINVVTYKGRLAYAVEGVGQSGNGSKKCTANCVHANHTNISPAARTVQNAAFAPGAGTVWVSGSVLIPAGFFTVTPTISGHLGFYEIFTGMGLPGWTLALTAYNLLEINGTDYHGGGQGQNYCFIKGPNRSPVMNTDVWYDWMLQINTNTVNAGVTASNGDGWFSFWCNPNTGSSWNIGDTTKTVANGGSQILLSSKATTGYAGTLPQTNVLQLKLDNAVPPRNWAAGRSMQWYMFGYGGLSAPNFMIYFDRTKCGRMMSDVT